MTPPKCTPASYHMHKKFSLRACVRYKEPKLINVLFKMYYSARFLNIIHISLSETSSPCCEKNCLTQFSSSDKRQCYELFQKKSMHEQRQFLLDLMVASQSAHQQKKMQVCSAYIIVDSTHSSRNFLKGAWVTK